MLSVRSLPWLALRFVALNFGIEANFMNRTTDCMDFTNIEFAKSMQSVVTETRSGELIFRASAGYYSLGKLNFMPTVKFAPRAG